MSTILVIARRELRERSFIFLTALSVATLPFLITLLPGASSFGRGELIGSIGLIGGAAFALGLAVILGANIVGRELADGRLSFYFSKPISAPAIWFGKLLAALCAIVVSFAIIGLPAYFGAGAHWRAVWTMQPVLLGSLLVGLAVLLFLISHAATTMVRSRTPLVLLDFGLVIATVVVVWMLARPLMNGLALSLAFGLIFAIVFAIMVALAIAPAWQLARGRADRRRNHFELSKVVWLSVAAILLASAAYVAWVTSADPEDLTTDATTLKAPAGPWFYASGETNGRFDYRSTFLINAANGEQARVPAPYIWHAAFTHDGRTAYWLRPIAVHPRNFRAQLWYRSLDMNAKTTGTTIDVGPNADVTMTDDLSRVAIIDGDVLTIRDLAHDRIVGSVHLPRTAPSRRYSMYFVGSDVVRVIDQTLGTPKDGSVAVNIYEFDAPQRTLTKTGAATFVTKTLYLTATPDGSRLVARMLPARRVAVLDARTGATLTEWPADAVGGFPRLLADGSLAGFVRNGDDLRFKTIAPNGAVVCEVKLPAAKYASPVRELAPGKVLVSLTEPRAQTLLIDVTRGVIEKTVDDLRVVSETSTAADPRAASVDPSQPVIGIDGTGSIVRWNPQTGERVVIVKRSLRGASAVATAAALLELLQHAQIVLK